MERKWDSRLWSEKSAADTQKHSHSLPHTHKYTNLILLHCILFQGEPGENEASQRDHPPSLDPQGPPACEKSTSGSCCKHSRSEYRQAAWFKKTKTSNVCIILLVWVTFMVYSRYILCVWEQRGERLIPSLTRSWLSASRRMWWAPLVMELHASFREVTTPEACVSVLLSKFSTVPWMTSRSLWRGCKRQRRPFPSSTSATRVRRIRREDQQVCLPFFFCGGKVAMTIWTYCSHGHVWF